MLHAAQNFAQKTFVKAEPLSPQMQELKNKAFGAMALKVLGAFGIALSNMFADFDLSIALYFGGLGVMFVSLLVLCNLIGSIQKHSKSQTLLKNLIIAEICGFVLGIMSFIQKTEWQNLYEEAQISLSIAALITLVLLAVYNYRYFKELALTTKQPLFLYAFWCGVTLILSPVALVLYVVAWVKFREVVGFDGKVVKVFKFSMADKRLLLLLVIFISVVFDLLGSLS